MHAARASRPFRSTEPGAPPGLCRARVGSREKYQVPQGRSPARRPPKPRVRKLRLLLILPGWIAWAVISLWFLYRVVRGWLALNERKPMLPH